MKLSLSLGYGSVEQLLNNVSRKELNDWIAYYSIEPFPQEREDIRNGSLMALMFNAWKSDKDSPKYPSDFIPSYWDEKEALPKAQTPQETQAIAFMINAAMGGRIIKRNEVM